MDLSRGLQVYTRPFMTKNVLLSMACTGLS